MANQCQLKQNRSKTGYPVLMIKKITCQSKKSWQLKKKFLRKFRLIRLTLFSFPNLNPGGESSLQCFKCCNRKLYITVSQLTFGQFLNCLHKLKSLSIFNTLYSHPNDFRTHCLKLAIRTPLNPHPIFY